jgi:hypothetical protein
MTRATQSAMLALIAASLLAGCASTPSGSQVSSEQTHIRIVFGSGHDPVQADLPFDAASRPAASYYDGVGAAHPAFYNAFDQLAQWSQTSSIAFTLGPHSAQYGFYVATIDSLPAAGTSGHYWLFAVNGVDSKTGMDEAQLHAGDIVTWTLS